MVQGIQGIPIIDLPLPVSGRIRKICHISDIHIRAGTDNNDPKLTRFDEYVGVIDRISKWLEKNHARDGDMVIVLTGDIVHDNKKAGAPCIELFYEVMNRLARIAPVYMIRGNHDYNQASVVPQDMLTSLMHGMKAWENVVYLKETGHYRALNVGFGLVAIQDALKVGDTHGRVEQLPAFPAADAFNDQNIEKRIALFHGDVQGAYPLEWIGKGWDYILLGDLHRMQVYGGKAESDKLGMDDMADGVFKMNAYKRENGAAAMWSYPGSTIQQNFGETMTGHGFLMWDLKEDKVEAYHVRNDYGFVNARMRIDDGGWDINLSFPSNEKNKDLWIDVDKALGKPWFPNIWRLRIKQKRSEAKALSMVDVHSTFEKKGIVLENVRAYWDDGEGGRDGDNGDVDVGSEGLDLRTFNDPQAWCDYIGEQVGKDTVMVDGWTQYIKTPQILMVNDDFTFNGGILDDVRDRNGKIGKALEDYKKTREVNATVIHGHTRFVLSYMDWSWVLCYRDGCWVNFKDMKGKVHCVGGKNGWGKTSFLETICLALYGEGFPSRSSKSHSASVICMQKPAMQHAQTSIVFEIDDVRYKIKRTFDVQSKDKAKLNARDITLEKQETANGSWELVHSGKMATGDWIKKHMGDVETFLTSVIVTQGFDGDFFDMKVDKQKEYLDKQLRLDSSTALMNVLKAASLAYDDLTKKLWTGIEMKKGELVGMGAVDKNAYKMMKAECDMCLDMTSKEKRVLDLKNKWSVVNESVLMKGVAVLSEELEKVHGELNGLLDDGDEDCVNLDELNKKHGKLDHMYNELAGKVNEELLEDDVDLEGDLEDMQNEKPVVDKPMGWTLEKAEKAYNDVVGKLKGCKDIAEKLEEARGKMEALKGDVDERRWDVERMQKRMNELGVKMSEMPGVSYSAEDYKGWLKAIGELEVGYESVEKAKEMLKAELEMRDRLRETVEKLKVEKGMIDKAGKSLDRHISCSNKFLKQVMDSAKYGDASVEVLENVWQKWKEMWGELVGAKEMMVEKAKRLEIESGHGYNDECDCCMARLKEKDALEEEYGAVVKRVRDIQMKMAKAFGGYVVESENDYKEACGVLLWKLADKMGELDKALGKAVKDLERAEEQIEEMKEEISEYERLEGQRDAQVEGKKMCEERDVVAVELRKVSGELEVTRCELVNVEKAFKEAEMMVRDMEERVGKVDDWTREKKELKMVVKGLGKWESWESGVRELEDAIKFVQVRGELGECKKAIEIGKKRMGLIERKMGLEAAVGVVGDYEEWVGLMKEVEEMRVKRVELVAKLGMMEAVIEKGERVQREVDEMTGVWERWRGIGETLKVVMGVFGRFKDWVFEERIMPAIVDGVNELLGVMCRNHRVIEIECVSGNGDGVFNWFMKDGVNKVPIEKASGFQRFAVSLGMRIVLGRLGVAGIRNRQLFIDEGFTACDGDNLGVVPEVLEELLDRYDSLVIVSHLEKLQEGIQSRIEIKRDGEVGVSWIGYGERIMELETKKKVGRLAKGAKKTVDL
jgi:DNA repair exonuclease SbcCD ATPase subunit